MTDNRMYKITEFKMYNKHFKKLNTINDFIKESPKILGYNNYVKIDTEYLQDNIWTYRLGNNTIIDIPDDMIHYHANVSEDRYRLVRKSVVYYMTCLIQEPKYHNNPVLYWSQNTTSIVQFTGIGLHSHAVMKYVALYASLEYMTVTSK
jgi:hypothetical protein